MFQPGLAYMLAVDVKYSEARRALIDLDIANSVETGKRKTVQNVTNKQHDNVWIENENVHSKAFKK